MCELVIDDEFSMNGGSSLTDADLVTLGSDSGYDLGNPEAVHQIVDSLLRNDQLVRTIGWTGRQQTIPVKVTGSTRAARADMAARLHKAIQHPRKLTLNPCDGWGAPGWWRIQYASMVKISDDIADKINNYQRYNVILGVDAWAKATTKFTATATPGSFPPDVLWNATSGATGWAASGGTLVDSTPTSIGVSSSGSAEFDRLSKTLAWDTLGMAQAQLVVEWTAGDLSTNTNSPWAYDPTNPSVTIGYPEVSRTSLGSGWYSSALLVQGGRSFTGIGLMRAQVSGSSDFTIRKVTLQQTALMASGTVQDLYLDIPGSAPADGDLTVTTSGGTPGLFIYQCPNFPEALQQPVLIKDSGGYLGPFAAPIFPEGTYHLIADIATIGTGVVDWSVTMGSFSQSGSVILADLPYSTPGLVCLANNIYLPPAAIDSTVTTPIAVTVTVSGGGTTRNLYLPWMEDPLTGRSAAYILTSASAATTFKYQAPTPNRPVPAYLFGGIQENSKLRGVAGEFRFDAGVNRLMLGAQQSGAWDPTMTWSGYPAFHTDVVDESRWWVR